MILALFIISFLSGAGTVALGLCYAAARGDRAMEEHFKSGGKP